MRYTISQPDYDRSPFTGMTRNHWLEVCQFLLEGIFSNIKSEEDLPLCPRHEFEISYPNSSSSPTRIYAERFEGLARSFLIAAAWLHNEPDAVVGTISVRAYYKKHILDSVTPASNRYLLSAEELKKIAMPGEEAFQHTCECASLVIGLLQCREVIWDCYTKAEQERIAMYLSQFGHGTTTAHNWRLFNMLILAFLDQEGYPIDQDMMRDHAQVILSYYVGDGWYRDGHRFDYYNAWAFQVYGPLWNHWYGYRQEPAIAQKIEEYATVFLQSYETMFDEQAQVVSWGRSGIYRNAATAPFAAACLLKHNTVKPGLARRLNSGSMLQFITREEMFVNQVPALGFYGPFPPLLQGYNCAQSPYWMVSCMLALSYPEEHPFWSDQESLGIWEQIGTQQQITTVMDGPGIVSSCLGRNRGTEFRTAKCLFRNHDEYIRYYIRLSFHSHFHWENFDFGGAEAMQYSLTYEDQELALIPNIMMYGGVKGNVLYRKEYFDFQYNFQGAASIDLADFAVSDGMVRVDKIRIPKKPFTLTLGAYGMPEGGRYQSVTIEQRQRGKAKAVILHNKYSQLAFVTYTGFESVDIKKRKGVNAETEDSWLAYGSCRRCKNYEYQPYVMISAILSRKNGDFWSDEELFCIQEIQFEDSENCGGYGKVLLKLRTGEQVLIDYEGIEGKLMI